MYNRANRCACSCDQAISKPYLPVRVCLRLFLSSLFARDVSYRASRVRVIGFACCGYSLLQRRRYKAHQTVHTKPFTATPTSTRTDRADGRHLLCTLSRFFCHRCFFFRCNPTTQTPEVSKLKMKLNDTGNCVCVLLVLCPNCRGRVPVPSSSRQQTICLGGSKHRC